MDDTMSFLREIERGYRADIIFGLRKAINDRYYGFKQADKIYDLKIQEILPKKKEHSRRKSGILDIFRRHPEEEEKVEPDHAISDDEKRAIEKGAKFVRAFLRQFYSSRFKLRLEEIVLISKDMYDPSKPLITPESNSTMHLNFELPQLMIQVFSSKNEQSRADILLHLVI
jgi:hypothetical protein